MTSYTLDQLLEDVLREKGALARGRVADKADYQQVWDAFNRYVTATIGKKQTLDVPNFCKIGWRTESHQTKAKRRPHFQLAESFLRVHQLDANRHVSVPDTQLGQVEEFNFSKAAIKYSQGLTKANMFVGLRAIVNKIGDVCARRQVCIDFEMGQLLCTDRAVHFAFVGDLYQQEGLDVPKNAVDEVSYRPSRTFAPATSEGLALSVRGKTRSRVVPTSLRGVSSDKEPREEARSAEGALPSTGAVDVDATSMVSSPSAIDRVRQDALARHIDDVQAMAEEVMLFRVRERDFSSRCESAEAQVAAARRAFHVEHQDEIKRQIRELEERRFNARANTASNAPQQNFPSFGENPNADLPGYVVERKRCLKDDLDQQVAQKQNNRKASRQRDLEVAAKAIEANNADHQKRLAEEAAKKQQEKNILADAWERAVRIKQVQSVIDAHHMTAPKHDLNMFTADLRRNVPPLPLHQQSSNLDAHGSSSVRPPTGSARRVPIGAAASLALNRNRQRPNSTRL